MTRYANDLADGDSITGGGEHEFLKNLCARLQSENPPASGEVGPGDDGAVFATSAGSLVATTDSLVENVHFRDGWLSAEELGLRAMAANLSDLAAMGATPSKILLSLSLPETTSAQKSPHFLHTQESKSRDLPFPELDS